MATKKQVGMDYTQLVQREINHELLREKIKEEFALMLEEFDGDIERKRYLFTAFILVESCPNEVISQAYEEARGIIH